jgi:hypothetical protein
MKPAGASGSEGGRGRTHAARLCAVLLEPDELASLADTMPDELRLIVLLAGWCGLRRGELFALTHGDIAAFVCLSSPPEKQSDTSSCNFTTSVTSAGVRPRRPVPPPEWSPTIPIRL